MNIESIRDLFPALSQLVHNKPLVYLDSAASTLKARPVVDALSEFYLYDSANVHRGAHVMSDRATEKFEAARETVRKFIGAKSTNEIIFTSGTTESVNIVAHGYSKKLKPGDEVVITEMEHHSNFVPWQVACSEAQATLKFIPVTESGELDLSKLDDLITEKTKLVSLNFVSNALGVVNPVEKVIKKAKSVGAKVLIDAAQAVSIFETNVQSLDCDYFVFSGHKLFGPHGIGVLFGKESELNDLSPFKTGGSMIDQVSTEGTTFLNAPQRFEAGTPNTAGAIGLAKAIDLIEEIGFKKIQDHEEHLMDYVTEQLTQIEGVKIFGPLKGRTNICSFTIEGAHPSDIGHLMDQQGIAIRTGHHCCQPLMKALGVTGTARASFSIYNTIDEAKSFVAAVKKCKEFI